MKRHRQRFLGLTGLHPSLPGKFWIMERLRLKNKKQHPGLPSGLQMSVYTSAHTHIHTPTVLLTHICTYNRDKNKSIISMSEPPCSQMANGIQLSSLPKESETQTNATLKDQSRIVPAVQ